MFLRRELYPPFVLFETPYEFIKKYCCNFSDFIKSCLDNNMYCFGVFDVAKIKAYGLNNGHYSHQVFIYGYDDTERKFYFADFLDENRYTFTECSFEEMEAACSSVESLQMPSINSIAQIKYVDDFYIDLDIEYVKKRVQDYIYPDTEKADNFSQYIMYIYGFVDWKVKCYSGVNVYDYLVRFIEYELELDKDKIDIRMYQAMYEHKEMMLARLRYLLDKGFISSDKSILIDDYIKIKDSVCNIRNLVMKYNITKKVVTLNKVKQQLFNTRERGNIIIEKHI